MTEIHDNWEILTCDPLKFIMDNPILIAFICMGKSIRIQRVKDAQPHEMYKLRSLCIIAQVSYSKAATQKEDQKVFLVTIIASCRSKVLQNTPRGAFCKTLDLH